MNSFFNFQFGEFTQTTPSWFDWFSLVISLGISAAGIIIAYYIANDTFNKEKRLKKEGDINNQDSEIKLFKNSISQLSTAIEKQMADLKRYIDEKNFKLATHPNVQIDFLKFIDIKCLYERIGFENAESIKKINDLFSSLYLINNFSESLENEVRAYIKKYNYHESKFYLYRQLLYTRYYSICNVRNESIAFFEGKKVVEFKEGDKFMPAYSELRIKTFNNKSIMDENGLKDRSKLIEEFVVPLINMAHKYTPEDNDAIEITSDSA